MDPKIDNLKLNSSTSPNSNNQSESGQFHRTRLKEEIMEKYNVSSDTADKILLKLEENLKKKKTGETYNHEVSNDAVINDFNQDKNPNSKQDLKSGNDIDITFSKNIQDENSGTSDVELDNLVNNEYFLKNNKTNNNVQSDIGNNSDNHTDISKKTTNVDSILEDIIPDYNQQISIRLEHVDLTFEVQNEKIDTLKEAFISTLKRNKSRKIEIHALNDVSFQIYKGEKVGIIGYNGAGKSTLLNVISGIYPPDDGEVFVYGKISPLLSLGAGFDHNFSGRKNIILNGAILGYDKEYLKSKMDEIIEFSELGELIDIPIKNYSSGMLAKLGFSIATSVNPDILIIDEILGVGDVTFKKKSADKIRSLMDGGTTVLLVSHSIPQIRNLCDKAIWMDNGSVRAVGEVNEICDEYLKDAEKATNEQLANIKLTN